MKKAYIKELQSTLLGSVTDSPEALQYFSTDGSIFQITPSAVIYPQNTADVRKTVTFVATRAAAGKDLSLVPRGLGSDHSGAAIGEGMQLVFPAHMNKLLRLDHDSVVVQPGMVVRTLQQTLHTHGRFLPAYPGNPDAVTVGGAVANNLIGEKSLKYGSTRDLVKRLKVVLSDGSIIEVQRISGRELNRKKGLSTLEGELYRKFDSLLLDHAGYIKQHWPKTRYNTAGYALDTVRRKDGSFDMSQVFIGSQGTLGVITEITLKILPYNPRTTLVVASFESAGQVEQAVRRLRPLGPSALELVDQSLLQYIRTNRPGELEGFVPEALPKFMLLIEFDNASQLAQKLHSNQAARLIGRLEGAVRVSTDPVEQVGLWKARNAVAALGWAGGARRPLPFIDDSLVPLDRLGQFIDKTHKLLAKHDLEAVVWGHVGDGNLRIVPFLDLGKKKDVDRLLSLSREFHQLVGVLGGTTSAGRGDGLVRALALENLYGEDGVELLSAVKHVFDPLNIFNPGKKTQATEASIRTHLRSDYGPKHFSYLPHL